MQGPVVSLRLRKSDSVMPCIRLDENIEDIGHQIIVSIIGDQIKADDIDIHLTRNSFPSNIPQIMSGVDRLLSCSLQTIAMFIVLFSSCFPMKQMRTVSGFGMGANASRSGCLGTKLSLDLTIHIPVPETQTAYVDPLFKSVRKLPQGGRMSTL